MASRGAAVQPNRVSSDANNLSSSEQVTLRRANQQATPGQANQQATPGRANQQATPGRANQRARPGRTNQQATPGQANQQATPGRANQQATPGQANQQATPGRANQQATPGRANQQATPGRANQQASDANPPYRFTAPDRPSWSRHHEKVFAARIILLLFAFVVLFCGLQLVFMLADKRYEPKTFLLFTCPPTGLLAFSTWFYLVNSMSLAADYVV